MRTIAISVALGLAVMATPVLAFEATGVWLTETDGGQVRIDPCGDSICGRLISSEELRRQPGLTDGRNRDQSLRGRALAGVLMLSGFARAEDGWRGGRIYNPEDGRTYASHLKAISPDRLQVKGCIGPFCRTQVWSRLQ